MFKETIIQSIGAEIEKLNKVKVILQAIGTVEKPTRYKLSEEGKKRIAESQKKRWAARKKATPTN